MSIANRPGIGKKRKREEDMISALPDDIIISILSLLPMKDAARTRLLSHRWENMWYYFGGSFDFYRGKTFVGEFGSKFSNSVNKVLTEHKSATLKHFRVSRYLDRTCGPSINSWIAFALEKRVQKLELDLMYPPLPHIIGKFYTLTLPVGAAAGFVRLTELCLSSLHMSNQVFEYILCNCPMLERLYLKWVASLTEVKFPNHYSGKLKRLIIDKCGNLVHVELSAPHLVSFTYGGQETSMVFKSVPCLSRVSFKRECVDYVVSQLRQSPSSFLCIPKLETLVLDLTSIVLERSKTFPIEFSEINNLKNLKLIIEAHHYPCLMFLTSILKAAPFLEKFTLQRTSHKYYMTEKAQHNLFNFNKEYNPIKYAPYCKFLKVVEMIGFDGTYSELELATHLLEKAVSLETMIINPERLVSKDENSPMSPKHKWNITQVKLRATELETKLPVGAKLKIF